MRTKVFFSHATTDRSIAVDYKKRLEQREIDCWIYEHDLEFGEAIEARVKHEIEMADFLIVVLSESGKESKWVRWEIGYAMELHQRNRDRRPVILPLFASDPKEGITVQPLRFKMEEPIGGLLHFSDVRGHRLHQENEIEELVKTLRPKTERIFAPQGEEQRVLFGRTWKLWQEMFPNDQAVPNRHDIITHIEGCENFGTVGNWTVTLIPLYFGTQADPIPVGFIYYSFNTEYNLAWVTFLGVLQKWRTGGRANDFFRYVRTKILHDNPNVRGIFCEVKTYEDLEKAFGELTDGSERAATGAEIAERLMNVRMFCNWRAKLLTGPDRRPIPVIQPAMDHPLNSSAESNHYLMFWDLQPDVRKSETEIDELGAAILRCYFDGFLTGWGPQGLDLPGYELYLDSVQQLQQIRMTGGTRFHPLELTLHRRNLIEEYHVKSRGINLSE